MQQSESYVQTITFLGAGAVNGGEMELGAPGRLALQILPTGCAITAAVLQIRPVSGADWADFIGGSSSVDWSTTSSPRLRDVSGTLPSSIAAAGNAWASVDLASFYSCRLVLTADGAGTALVRMQQR